MAENKELKHVVMFPFMAQGHFIPFLSLAKTLTSQGLMVSFLTTTASAPKLQQEALGSSIRFVPLSLPPIPGIPPGCESTDALHPIGCILLLISSHKLSQAFEDWLEQAMAETSGKPACIINDVFLPWAAQSASKFGIPCVVFHTTGAMAASIQQFLFSNPEIVSDREVSEVRDRCMNLNLRRAELPHMLRSEYVFPDVPDTLPLLQQAYGSTKENCAAMLVNTIEALEAEYVRYLEEATGKPVWCIASPYLKRQQGIESENESESENEDEDEDGNGNESGDGDGDGEGESECIRWLDTQGENTVLYVSFGSQIFLSEVQTEALARGIAGSNRPFIWTIKDPVGSQVNSCDFLPEGFIEETRNRGMVIHDWVPQRLILSHPSIALFMTHCGWNSTMESISAGVPILAWPFIVDQFFNAKLVTENLGIGLQLCEGFDAIPTAAIVENTVKAAMTGEDGKDMRQRALQLKESIDEASCDLSVKGFVSYILSLGFDEDN